MLSATIENITVQFDHDGHRDFLRTGTVNWFGKPVIILFRSLGFHFDLEGRIQRIEGFDSTRMWDWIQRTMADDWLYYDGAGYSASIPQPEPLIGDSVWAVNGRTDLPMLQDHGGLQRNDVSNALKAFDDLIVTVRDLVRRKPQVDVDANPPPGATDAPDANRLWRFLNKVAKNGREQLQRIANQLRAIHGGMEVLPPDTIGVDYRVLLLKVMEGCANACRFCVARGTSAFALKSKGDIDQQIEALADVYGEDLCNYNSVVLGECDALVSPDLEYAATKAFDILGCGSSYLTGSNLFLFSTNRSFCDRPDRALDRLEALPFQKIVINIGWEAASGKALSQLGKQQTEHEVFLGMAKAGAINRTSKKVQISGNFLVTDQYECDDIAKAIRATQYCGQLYLSPLRGHCSARNALQDLHALKRVSPDVRVRLYTMQRI